MTNKDLFPIFNSHSQCLVFGAFRGKWGGIKERMRWAAELISMQ